MRLGIDAGGTFTDFVVLQDDGRIATFKVPRYVRFVSEWPMSGTKIQKFVLREQLERELRSRGITEAPVLRTQRNMPRRSEAT